MTKSNEHMFLEINLTDEQAQNLARWIVQWVEMYLLENNLGEHVNKVKSIMSDDIKIFLTKINLSSNIY